MWLTWLTMLLASISLGAVTYRVTRFLIHDTMFDETRRKLRMKLIGTGDTTSVFRTKLYDLTICPYCMSVWVAGGAVALTAPFADIPLPVWTWLGVCTASLAFWRYIEQD